MKIKINLGCGNKIKPANEGWVNVDIIPPIKTDGMLEADIINAATAGFLTEDAKGFVFHRSDIRTLRWIEDNTVDEVHAYHVIEHFYKDEVQGVLKEILRVLKPGGVVVLEQPDVVKCAANFLAGLVNGTENLGYNLGLLGFYGDGSSEQPYMGHKWGWYPDSLGEQLSLAGFTNLMEKIAVNHAGPIRDFRLEGNKPTTNE